jgi:hypothetical protein
MAFKAVKCESCGARIRIDDTEASALCAYCHTEYIAEQKTAPPPPQQNFSPPPAYDRWGTPQNNAQGQPPPYTPPRSKRPRFNPLGFVLFLFGFWPGLLYAIYVGIRKSMWDQKYG